jgi:hypothetical protein
MFPIRAAVEALRAFAEKFPTVPPRIYVQSLGAAAELVLDGTCMIGLLPLMRVPPEASHPLSRIYEKTVQTYANMVRNGRSV